MKKKLAKINSYLPPIFKVVAEGGEIVLYKLSSKKDKSGKEIAVRRRHRTLGKATDDFVSGMLESININIEFSELVGK